MQERFAVSYDLALDQIHREVVFVDPCFSEGVERVISVAIISARRGTNRAFEDRLGSSVRLARFPHPGTHLVLESAVFRHDSRSYDYAASRTPRRCWPTASH